MTICEIEIFKNKIKVTKLTQSGEPKGRSHFQLVHCLDIIRTCSTYKSNLKDEADAVRDYSTEKKKVKKKHI